MKKLYLFLFIILSCFIIRGQTNCVTPFGTLLGSFNGVDAYSNCNTNYYSEIHNYWGGTYTGIKWQCVEYVNRYYKIVYGLDLFGTKCFGNANSYYSNAKNAGLLAYPNGGSIAPQVGDILCSNGMTYGHVAIVMEVGTNFVKVIHQNFSNSNCFMTLNRSGNTVSGFNGNYPIEGWVRYQNQTISIPATPTNLSPGSINSPGPTLTSTNVTLSWSASAGATYYDLGVRDMSTNTLVVDATTNSTTYTVTLQAGKTYRWNVAAANSAGKSKFTDPLYFTIAASTPTPTITSIYPSSIAGSNSLQPITIYGTNFQPTSYLIFTDPHGNTYNSSNYPERFTYVNSGQINYNINNMNDCGTWYVRVYNSSSVYSNSYSFNVGCCSYTLSFYSLSVSYSSGNGSVNVSTSSGCSWTASSNNSSWLNITSGSSGNGSGTVYFSFSENTSSSSRTGTITIANQTFTITQAGKASTPTPTITSIYPSSITGSNSLQPITIYGTNFQPTSYLIFTDPHGNTYNSSNYPERFTYVNSGQINYNINNMNDCGTWYVRVYNSSSVYSNSYSFNVGCCSYTLSFYSLSVSYSSGNGSVNVSTSSGCSWTASSNNSSWLNITSGSSGNGSGTVYFSFSENTSSSSRTGTITIANQTFTITQAGKASTPTPTITSIYPSSITGSNSLQPITIYGTNFQPTSYLIFTDPHGNTYNSSNYPERFTYVNSGQINYNINNMNDCGTWYVRVYNSSSVYSNSYNFNVCSTNNSFVYGFDTTNPIIASAIPDSIKFAFFKATESIYKEDNEFKGSINGALNKNIVVGAYHFATPLFSPDYYQVSYDHKNTVSDEVNNFLNSAKNYIGKGFLPPALDIEDQIVSFKSVNGKYDIFVNLLSGNSYYLDANSNAVSLPSQKPMNVQDLANWIYEFCTGVKSQTSVMPLLYTTFSYAQSLYPYLLNDNIKLFIADTSSSPGSPKTNGWPWLFHQYSHNNYLDYGLVDKVVFNGDINAFNALINLSSGINDLTFQNQLNIYPNPASTSINIKVKNADDNLTIEIIDLQGIVVFSNNYRVMQNEVITINISSFANGIYIVKLNGENNFGTVKMIKE